MNKKFILGMVATSLTISASFAKADVLSTPKRVGNSVIDLINSQVNSSTEHDGFFEQAKNTLATVALDAASVAVLNKMYGGEIRRRATIIANIDARIKQLASTITDEDLEGKIKEIRALESSYQNKTTVTPSEQTIKVTIEGKEHEVKATVNNTVTERTLTSDADAKINALNEQIRTAPSALEKGVMMGRLQKELAGVSGRVVSFTKNSGLVLNKLLVRGSQVILIVDALDAGYVSIVLNKDPEVMPVVSALVDKSGGKAFIDEKAKAINDYLKSL